MEGLVPVGVLPWASAQGKVGIKPSCPCSQPLLKPPSTTTTFPFLPTAAVLRGGWAVTCLLIRRSLAGAKRSGKFGFNQWRDESATCWVPPPL